jgi:xylulose-5-phosphate/fructose-6-phosphate phosphoketolase
MSAIDKKKRKTGKGDPVMESGLDEATASAVERYRRAVNYLAAAQIYLKDNPLLEEPLSPMHIKDRLLGHWGTAPGINLMYAHLNRLIINTDAAILLITGPGHGAAANLANMYLEGTLSEYFPDLTRDRAGLARFLKSFSWPDAFPSHLYPGYPGVIHEGGELGYALSTAFGAALDNPDLIVACIVGDGEAETGPTAGAWHSNKFLNPATDSTPCSSGTDTRSGSWSAATGSISTWTRRWCGPTTRSGRCRRTRAQGSPRNAPAGRC